MRVADLIQILEEWAPKWIAWEKDNVGLQVGDEHQQVRRVLITLDVNQKTVAEAIARKAELIISHHPLLFRPPSAITTGDAIGQLVLQLIKNGISLFSAHTNLDFAPGGVSFALADTLGLKNVHCLAPLKDSLAKIVVFVPEEYVERVMQAMAREGAGVIGKYSSCSFSMKGRGSFFGASSSNPFMGKRRTLEFVEEARLEMVMPRADVPRIIAAMKSVHPYEEVAYDVYHLDNPNPNFGMGAIGELPKPQLLSAFLKTVKRALGCNALRFTGNRRSRIQKVAVCGGAGSDLLSVAIAAKADAFITADVRYHTFQTATDRIVLVDAGHWETEHIILRQIANRIQSAIKAADRSLLVFISEHSMNPIQTI